MKYVVRILFSVLILSGFVSGFTVAAADQTARFRSGTILAAELSTKKPEITNSNKYDPLPVYDGAVGYAVLFVKFDAGRTFTTYDYVLTNSSKTFRCCAVAEGGAQFNTDIWELKTTDPEKIYRLLFIVQILPTEDQFDYNLRFKLFQSPVPSVKIRFVNLDKNRFSYTSEVPATGTLGISLLDLLKLRSSDAVPAAKAEAPKTPVAADQKPADVKAK